jgi:hypothetical protein
MKVAAQVNTYIDRMSGIHPDRLTMQGLQDLDAETCRLANAVARMYGTLQQGMLTLQKLRTGGEQRAARPAGERAGRRARPWSLAR